MWDCKKLWSETELSKTQSKISSKDNQNIDTWIIQMQHISAQYHKQISLFSKIPIPPDYPNQFRNPGNLIQAMMVVQLKEHKGMITTIKADTVNECFYTGAMDKAVLQWSLPQGKDITELEKIGCYRIGTNHSPLNDIILSGDNQFLFFFSWGKFFSYYKTVKPAELIYRFQSTTDLICIALSKNNRIIYTGTINGFYVMNCVGEIKCKIETPFNVRCITCTEKKIYIGGDNTLYIYTFINTGLKLLNKISFHSDITSLTLFNEEKKLAVAHSHSISILDLTHNTNNIEKFLFLEIKCKGKISTVVCYDPKGWLTIATEVGLEILQLDKNISPQRLLFLENGFFAENHPEKIKISSLAWNTSGTNLYVGFADGFLRILKIIE